MRTIIPAHAGYFVLSVADDGAVFRSPVVAWSISESEIDASTLEFPEPVTIDGSETDGCAAGGPFILTPDGQVMSTDRTFATLATFTKSVPALIKREDRIRKA
jgi:hypothetical protein